MEAGLKAKDFINSHLGQYVTDRIKTEIDDLKDKLVHASDLPEIQKLQTEIKIRAKCIEYILSAINAGEQAEQQARQLIDEE